MRERVHPELGNLTFADKDDDVDDKQKFNRDRRKRKSL